MIAPEIAGLPNVQPESFSDDRQLIITGLIPEITGPDLGPHVPAVEGSTGMSGRPGRQHHV